MTIMKREREREWVGKKEEKGEKITKSEAVGRGLEKRCNSSFLSN